MLPDTVALTDLPELADLLLALGKVRLRIATQSMVPTLRPGDEIVVCPVDPEELQQGDLLLFTHNGHLICHRLVEVSTKAATLLTRGDAAHCGGEQTGRDQLLGKVVAIRKRTPWVALKETLKPTFLLLLLRWLPHLQRLATYRLLLRPLIAPRLSYHLGLAQGARWYEWQELRKDNGFPALPRSTRSHLLVTKLGKDVTGWAWLSWENSGWRRGDCYVRLRYRGLDLEDDLTHLARLILSAQ